MMPPPGYMKVGTAPISVTDIRLAKQEVDILDAAPEGSKPLGEIYVVRCHQNQFEDEPTEEMVQDDLLIEALAKGANAVTDITISKRGDARWNCWYLLEGKAQGFVLPK